MKEEMQHLPPEQGEQVDESRRAALRSIRKYAAITAGASVVALSAHQAVAQPGASNPGCDPSNVQPGKCP